MLVEDIKKLITKIQISGQVKDIGVRSNNVIIDDSTDSPVNLTEKLEAIDSAISNIEVGESPNALQKSNIYVKDDTLVIDNAE